MFFKLLKSFRKKKTILAYNSKDKTVKSDYFLWGVPLSLCALSGILIASTQRQVAFAEWYQHWLIAGVGILIALTIAQLPLERLRPFLVPFYWITVVSLLAVRLVGTSALGAQRWLSFGGINLQPSEFAKIIVILLLASVLENHQIEAPKNLVKPISVILLPWMLVFIQPDLGTSLVFGAVLLAMLYWAGTPAEWILLALSLILTAVLSGALPLALILWIPFLGILAYRSLPYRRIAAALSMLIQGIVAVLTPWFWLNALKDYQRDRLVLFLDPTKDPLGGGYHLLQSQVGIGSGGIFGTGLMQGHLTKLRFIPEQHTDFIFSALGEELGFMGTTFVIGAFLLLIVRLLKIARYARTDFESLVVIGIAAMLMFQVVVNIFMTIGLGPVTGIPLPFMSYGRSALLMNFIALGLCLSISRRGHVVSTNW